MIKVLVVEDEIRIREGIVHLIHKIGAPFIIVGQASNGEEGLNMAKNLLPDLIISDIRMEKLSGLQMVEYIRLAGIETIVILLTAYSDFEYARKAIKIGVYEYLLKPVDYIEFTQLLDRVRTEILQKRQELFTKKVFHFLTSETQEISFDESTYFSQIHYDSLPSKEVLTSLKRILGKEPLQIGRDIYFSLAISEYVDSELIIEKIRQKMILNSSKHHFCIGYKLCVENQIMKKTYLESIMEQGIIYESDRVLTDIVERKLIRQSSGKLFHKIKKQMELISKKNDIQFNDIEKIMNDIYDNCNQFSIFQIKDLFTQLVFQYKKENRIDSEIFGTTMSSIQKALLFIDLQEAISMFCLSLIKNENQFAAIPLPINRAIEIVSKRYSDGVTLENIADEIGVTKEYLSAQFHHVMGRTFTEYIREYRMTIAKQLLLETDLKIYEIASKVGINDSKYFSSIFKQLTGVTPKDYKMLNLD